MIRYLLSVFCTLRIIFAADSDCGIIPISQWSGETLQRKEKLHTPVKVVVIQHKVSPQCSTDNVCENILRGIRDHHIKELQFTDIGNSFLISSNGHVYEGAGWHHIGAHTRGYNHKAISISFIGNFQSELPTAEALQAAKDLIACGVSNELISIDYDLVGHRQLSATQSPGDSLQRLIETWPRWKENVS